MRTTRFNIKKFYMVLILRRVLCTDLITLALYFIKWLVFIAVVESVYSVVRSDSLYEADYVLFLKGEDAILIIDNEVKPAWSSYVTYCFMLEHNYIIVWCHIQ